MLHPLDRLHAIVRADRGVRVEVLDKSGKLWRSVLIDGGRQNLEAARAEILLRLHQKAGGLLTVRTAGQDEADCYHFALILAQRYRLAIGSRIRQLGGLTRQISRDRSG